MFLICWTKYYILVSVASHTFMEASEKFDPKWHSLMKWKRLAWQSWRCWWLFIWRHNTLQLSQHLSVHTDMNICILSALLFKAFTTLPSAKLLWFDLTIVGKERDIAICLSTFVQRSCKSDNSGITSPNIKDGVREARTQQQHSN